MTSMERLQIRQPAAGLLTAVAAGIILLAVSLDALPAHMSRATGTTLLVACCAAAAIILGHRFPIRLPDGTRIYLGTVPLFLSVALLPLPVAISTVALGKLAGELVVRGRTGNYFSDIASEVGRWVLIAYVASSFVEFRADVAMWHYAYLLGAAVILWIGDIVTSPLVLTPITGQRPTKVVLSVAREAGATEAAGYVIGILGAMAATQALWSLLLLPFPVALAYLSFKSAKDMNQTVRRLLTSVVGSSPDAILLLKVDGSIILGNPQAAALWGYAQPNDLAGLSVSAVLGSEGPSNTLENLKRILELGTLRDTQQMLVRADGRTSPGEVSWSLITDEREAPQAVMVVARDITERKRTEAALEHQALHDALTQLPNRTLFQLRLNDALARAKRDGVSFALCLLDMDRFKEVNDTYGHQRGDMVLQLVAQRLSGVLRETDTLARLGGDEFALLLSKVDEHGAEMALSRISTVADEPFFIGNQVIDIGLSIGVAVYGRDGQEGNLLLERADAAMYTAKRAGKLFSFYEPVERQARVDELRADDALSVIHRIA